MEFAFSRNALLLLCELSGIVLLLSVIWLLNRRRIYLDRETKQPVEFEFPLLGKLKTQNPVLAMVLIGAGLIIYPVQTSRNNQITVEGNIVTERGKAVTVTVVPVPQFQQTMQGSGPFKLQVPVLPDVNYRALFVADGKVLDDQSFDLTDRKLKSLNYSPSGDSTPLVTPVKEASDAKLQQLGLGH